MSTERRLARALTALPTMIVVGVAGRRYPRAHVTPDYGATPSEFACLIETAPGRHVLADAAGVAQLVALMVHHIGADAVVTHDSTATDSGDSSNAWTDARSATTSSRSRSRSRSPRAAVEDWDVAYREATDRTYKLMRDIQRRNAYTHQPIQGRPVFIAEEADDGKIRHVYDPDTLRNLRTRQLHRIAPMGRMPVTAGSYLYVPDAVWTAPPVTNVTSDANSGLSSGSA